MELLVPHETSAVFLAWKMTRGSLENVMLKVRLSFSGRNFHALHHENTVFRFDPEKRDEGWLVWSPYQGVPSAVVRSSGNYRHEPHWYRDFLCTEEQHRGQDCLEDFAAPGVFSFHLSTGGRAELAFAGDGHESVFSDSWIV